MISRVLARGTGFAGAIRYVTHDKPTAETPRPATRKRVMGVTLRGLPMIEWDERAEQLTATAMRRVVTDAPVLKRLAGVSARGKKLRLPVTHAGLSWPAGARPSWEMMVEAGESWLEANGLSRHQVVMAGHNEPGKVRHLHMVINVVDPVDGRAYRGDLAVGGSRWAEKWEREHGGIVCHGRVAKNEARREIREAHEERRVIERYSAAAAEATAAGRKERCSKAAARMKRAERRRPRRPDAWRPQSAAERAAFDDEYGRQRQEEEAARAALEASPKDRRAAARAALRALRRRHTARLRSLGEQMRTARAAVAARTPAAPVETPPRVPAAPPIEAPAPAAPVEIHAAPGPAPPAPPPQDRRRRQVPLEEVAAVVIREALPRHEGTIRVTDRMLTEVRQAASGASPAEETARHVAHVLPMEMADSTAARAAATEKWVRQEIARRRGADRRRILTRAVEAVLDAILTVLERRFGLSRQAERPHQQPTRAPVRPPEARPRRPARTR